ncbi:hypothetical protein Mal4_47150 [Maioricimonas rarisocia]|uniref:Carboxypeptidase regulatory-like domain-containing protein n=1 Tax=Maioricimonas rarisocia TaxID=2528026 RepID=A0A517ZD25_9PLAN|nr:hypothetical protein [Maioricimonas rarisocia]QDU40359.1 hypothetical protein Mal4_47150 [Maioricimonas rarisocia]
MLAVALLLALGCGENMPVGDRVPTVPVKGQLLVDGEPAAAVKVQCVRNSGPQDGLPGSGAFTDEEGRFAVSTFVSGDGVPTGAYRVTFFWGQYNLMNGRYVGPDKLEGKYSDPDESKITFTVEDQGKPVDLGTIELSTK